MTSDTLSANFKPVYDPNVREFYTDRPDIPVVGVSEFYCLTVPSARLLALILADLKPTIEERIPWTQTGGSPFGFNKLVPWLVLTVPEGPEPNAGKIVSRNAGQLAIYWTWGLNGLWTPAQSEQYCRGDILGTF